MTHKGRHEKPTLMKHLVHTVILVYFIGITTVLKNGILILNLLLSPNKSFSFHSYAGQSLKGQAGGGKRGPNHVIWGGPHKDSGRWGCPQPKRKGEGHSAVILKEWSLGHLQESHLECLLKLEVPSGA